MFFRIVKFLAFLCIIFFFTYDLRTLLFLKTEVQEILVEDETGKTMDARKVFSESLRFLVNSLFDEVTKQQTDI